MLRFRQVLTAILAFFASGFFFISRFFVVFSPLPILLLTVRRGPAMGLAAVCFNAALISFVVGEGNGLFYMALLAGPALVFSTICFRGTRSLNTAGSLAVLSGIALAALWIWSQGIAHAMHPLDWIRSEVYGVLDILRAANPKVFDETLLTEVVSWDQFRAQVFWEIPGMALVFMIILLALNVLLVNRLVPGVLGVPENRNLALWKAPDFWLWPTLLAALVVFWPEASAQKIGFSTPLVSGVAQNILNVSMALYGLQGLSVVGAFLTRWKIRGLFRSVLVLVAVMTPMVVGVIAAGFLDLWFDFRRKFGHT